MSSPATRGRARRKGAATAAFQSPLLARLFGALGRVAAPSAVHHLKKPKGPLPPASEAVGTEMQPPPGETLLRAPRKPSEDPLFQKVKGEVRTDARRQRHHAPPGRKRTEAEAASALEQGEQESQNAKETNTGEMERAGAAAEGPASRFSAEGFKEELKKKISAKKPRDEDEAKALARQPPLENFEQDFSGKVAQEQGKVTGPLDRKAVPDPTGGKAEKPEVAVPKPVSPPAAKPVAPQRAAPKPKAWWEISRKKESDKLDSAMSDNRLSEDQLEQSREPSFVETLKVKREAQKKAAEAPNVYRQREATILQTAQARADKSLASGLTAMNAAQRRAGAQVFGGQQKTETRTEKRQREIKGTIDGIYEGTVKAVKAILEGMAKQVKEDFAKALKDRTDEFNSEVRRRISDYYGDWRIDDDLFGPDDVIVNEDGSTRAMTLEEKFGGGGKRINPDVYQIFVEEKDKFVRAMDQALDVIARNVQTGLTAAHNQIKLGEAGIALFKASLHGSELEYADELEKEVKMKFETLESSIDDAREDLLQTLADQYSESVQQLEKSFNEINDELKKSWLDRALDFIKTIGKTIFQLAELLFTILVRMAHLVWDIVKHPIRFFETLVAGLMQGIRDFISNIGTYLQEAFWTWITGATSAKGIQLSGSSGIGSLFSIVLQVLSLTPADLRAIAEKVLGREFMALLDKGVQFVERALEIGAKVLEPVVILLTKGPGALWDYIKENLTSIVQSSFDRIRESVFNTFVEKALKWIAGFFIPGGGFVKVVKAVFRAFQFVADNLERIRHFFDSVFDAMESAVQGKTEGVASKIVDGLKLGIVLALDFLAKQIGLGAIVDGVHRVIQSLRRPIVAAIEWLLNKIKPFALKLAEKGKELVSKALGGDPKAPPEERVRKAVLEGKRAVERFSGRRVGAAVLRPLLGAIRLRHRLTSLDVVSRGDVWAVRGVINPAYEDGTTVKVIPEGSPDDWPTGSAVDPIPIKWFKPRDGFYPTIRVRGGAERTPRQGIRLPAVARTEERQLTVRDSNFMAVGDKIARQDRPSSEPAKNSVRGHLNNLLELPASHPDRIFFDGSGNYAVDHVRDLTWRGADADHNLWPLDADKNNAINASHNQQVRVREGNTTRTNAAYTFPDKWFIIMKIAPTAPRSSSDHRTTNDHPMNSGEGDIPKRSK